MRLDRLVTSGLGLAFITAVGCSDDTTAETSTTILTGTSGDGDPIPAECGDGVVAEPRSNAEPGDELLARRLSPR